MMKLFLDDLRASPDSTWTVARAPAEAIALLKTGTVEEISFDHDLGFDSEGQEMIGYEVLLRVEERVALHGFDPPMAPLVSAGCVPRSGDSDVASSGRGDHDANGTTARWSRE